VEYRMRRRTGEEEIEKKRMTRCTGWGGVQDE
jgi:hypothetical protein